MISIKFYRFAVVGAFGFLVDGGLLIWLLSFGFDIYLARSVSFLSAVTFTWVLNRSWTFHRVVTTHKTENYVKYFMIQGSGAAINMALFFVFILMIPKLIEFPLLPLALGAAVSLVWNYYLSQQLVFKSNS